jgi:hypothetical protein
VPTSPVDAVAFAEAAHRYSAFYQPPATAARPRAPVASRARCCLIFKEGF